MTTFQSLVDQIQESLNDAAVATWSEAQLAGWLNDAIQEYSQYFPRTLTDAIGDTVDVRKYDLQADFLEPLSVEFPTGDDPPSYLLRRPHTHRDFWTSTGYYDIVPRADDTDVDEIWISEKPDGSQTVTVNYHALHALIADIATPTLTGTVTIPEHHHHIVHAYVVWQASLNRQMTEEANPTSNSSLLMAQLATNTDRLKRAYVDALARAVYATQTGKSGVVTWHDAVYDAVY